MRTFTLLKVALTTIILSFIFSCKNDLPFVPYFEDELENPSSADSTNWDAVNEYVIAQNYLMEIINATLTTALLHPELNGFAPDPNNQFAEVRNGCPMVTFINSSPDSLIIDFGPEPGCNFTHPLGGGTSNISGSLLLETYGPMSDGSTKFLKFDEIRINDKRIKFLPGNPAQADWIKFLNTTPGAGYNFEAFIDGSLPPNVDPSADSLKSKFQIIDIVTGDSTELFPTYSGTPAFILDIANYDLDPNTPQDSIMFTYADLVNGCYEIDILPINGYFYDNSGTLVEHYNIIKQDDPLIYKPLCRWLQGGTLHYIRQDDTPNIPTNKTIYFGADENGNPDRNLCDGWVLVDVCHSVVNNVCVNEETFLLECP